jgi:hypothetical protein
MAPIAFLGTSVENGSVLIAIPLAVLPIAAISFARSGAAWRGIGGGASRSPTEDDSRATKEAEVRQMVEAKAYRREQCGESLDVEAEVQRRLGDLIGWDG